MLNVVLLSEKENKHLQANLIKMINKEVLDNTMSNFLKYTARLFDQREVYDSIFCMVNKSILDSLYINSFRTEADSNLISSICNKTFFDNLYLRHSYLAQVLNSLFVNDNEKFFYEKEIRKELYEFMLKSFKNSSSEFDESIFNLYLHIREDIGYIRPSFHVFELTNFHRPAFLYSQQSLSRGGEYPNVSY